MKLYSVLSSHQQLYVLNKIPSLCIDSIWGLGEVGSGVSVENWRDELMEGQIKWWNFASDFHMLPEILKAASFMWEVREFVLWKGEVWRKSCSVWSVSLKPRTPCHHDSSGCFQGLSWTHNIHWPQDYRKSRKWNSDSALPFGTD